MYRPIKRTCPYCGAKFYPITPVQRYCKDSHRQMGHLRRKKGQPERRTKTMKRKGGHDGNPSRGQ